MEESEKYERFKIMYREINQGIYESAFKGYQQGIGIIQEIDKMLADLHDSSKKESLVKARDDLRASLQNGVRSMERLINESLNMLKNPK